jgi:hypothetical protein
MPLNRALFAALLTGLALTGLAGLMAGPVPVAGQAGAPASVAAVTDSPIGPGADLFTNGPPPRLAFTLAPEDLARLRANGREDVPARLLENGRIEYRPVRLRLKGSTGSYRNVDDKPSFTLRFDEPPGGERFHGLRKVHLNNSVEDPAYFNELAGSLLFRAAGVPAPRVGHALVTLNGRRLGLYVLKEGVAEEFLAAHFGNPEGNLYDTGPGHDVDEALQKEAGNGPDDRRDLLALAGAAREPNLATRWAALGAVLDRDRFVTFMALEVLTGHRDGYCLARNNFRIYHAPDAGRLVFLPHGMDQLFGLPEATLHPAMQGLVARAMLETSAGRAQYQTRLGWLATNVLDVARLHQRADDLVRQLRGGLTAKEARDLDRAIASLKARIRDRRRSVDQQLAAPGQPRLQFTDGRSRIVDWRAVDAPAQGQINRVLAPDGRPALHIRAGPRTAASWRACVWLAAGSYEFQATVLTRGVQALPFGRNRGAGIRVTGANAPEAPPYDLVGDRNETGLEHAFTLETEGQVELICELRASAGEAWFLLESLQLLSLP